MTHTAQAHSPDAPARRGRRRLTAALLASLLLHAVGLVLTSTPPGTPSTSGPRGQPPLTLHLRLATAPALTSIAAPPLPSAPEPSPPTPPASAPSTPAPFDPERYLPLTALDLKPLVQREPSTLLPADAAPGQSGTLILEIFLNASGGIDRITVIASSPPDLPASWRNAAISGFAGATFSPGWKDGQAVPSRLRLEISHQPVP